MSAAAPGAGLRLLARIWATVDLEWALRDHGDEPERGRSAIAEPHLGARVVLITDPAGDPLALAEPSTEGRLAASLARHGEGVAGRYLAVPRGQTLEDWRHHQHAAGIAVSRVEHGPFGPSVLLVGGPAAGPHVIVAEPRSIPSPP